MPLTIDKEMLPLTRERLCPPCSHCGNADPSRMTVWASRDGTSFNGRPRYEWDGRTWTCLVCQQLFRSPRWWR